jgi:hypothetical protein
VPPDFDPRPARSYSVRVAGRSRILRQGRKASMKALVFLLVLPVLIGFASEMVFRDAKKASFTAAVGSALAVFLGVIVLDPAGTWNWVAALLVSPLPIALGVVTVLYCYGRLQMRKPSHERGA